MTATTAPPPGSPRGPSAPDASPATAGTARIDPELRAFMDAISAVYAQAPAGRGRSVPTIRTLAEQGRRPWVDGGPPMASIHEDWVACGDSAVRVRIYDPGGTPTGPAPALVYLHGGGFVLFSLDTHDRLMREYAARTGAVVVGVDYSRAPETRFPRAIHESVAVLRWLASGQGGPRIDPSRLVVGGDSAGANLAVATCVTLRDAGEAHSVRGMLLNYGFFDTDTTRASHRRFGAGGYFLDSDEIDWFLGHYLTEPAERTHPLMRVLHADLAGLPSALLVITEYDVLHDENVEMAQRLARAGVPVQSIVYPRTIHSFLEAVATASVSRRAFDDSARWLRDTWAAADTR